MVTDPKISNNKTPGWKFILYVTSTNTMAQENIRRLNELCEQFVPEDYDIKVIDVMDHPGVEIPSDILAIPTVVRTAPLPERRVIGDLSAKSKAIAGLGFPQNG